jgi:hypothetical protein
MGGDRLDRGEDRLHGRDLAELGSPGRTRLRHSANEILRKVPAYFAAAELD